MGPINRFTKCACLGGLLFFLAWISCTSSEPSEKEDIESLAYDVVVYCDFTSSLHKNSVEHIKSCSRSLIETIPTGRIRFFEVCRVHKPHFFELDKKLLGEYVSNVEKKRREFEIIENIQLLEHRIDSLKELYTNDDSFRKGANSCMLNSMRYASKELQETRSSQKYFILISDMIEECDASIVGELYMNTKNGRNAQSIFEDVKERVLQNYEPNFSLSGIKPIIIHLTRQDQSAISTLAQVQFEQMWQEIYLKMGVTDSAIKNWKFKPGCPSF